VYNTYIKNKGDRKMMNAMRETLLDRIIRIYGFEHEVTIQFADMCEKWDNNSANDRMLEILVDAHEEHPQIEEDEDE
jgi:hypothetical protein